MLLIFGRAWYDRNEDIQKDLVIPPVKDVIRRYAVSYNARIATHPNRLAAETINTTNTKRRLKRNHPADLVKDTN
jgi:hypothetical protein